jgi:2-dehydro-3-deoxyphosphogluconate aldolase/(4S)-4-hydroxy-2-oxoglutarate aldolase
MNPVLEELSLLGIIPVIALEHTEDALPLAKALCEGGLPCAEVTFRTAAAEESIKIMTQAYPDMLVGAGTILTTEQVDRAVKAGARFIVSPGFNPKVVAYCIANHIPITPGCSSPSDIEQALEFNLEVVKFFPAEASGGLAKIKAMSAPYGSVKFMPTGGIDLKNLNSYLGFNKIIACGGSFMVSKEHLEAKDFDTIKKLTKDAVSTMLGFELKHLGINAGTASEAESIATTFESMFNFTKNQGNNSIFAGTGIEVMTAPHLGKRGHIAIGTNYINRALYYLQKQGYCFDMEAATYDKTGALKTVYFKDEVGDFALHLLQK